MNKFRNNLHSAFFFPGSNGNGEFYKHFEDAPESENKSSEEEVRQEEVEQKQAAEVAADERDAVLDSSKKEQSEVVDDAIKAQSTMEHVDNVFGYGYSSQVLNEIYKSKNNGTLDREKVKQIQGRIAENIKLGNVWEKNIQEGYKHLLKTLLDNKYFHNPFHKNEEEIRKMYTREIESQYEKHVWNADDKTFSDTKNKLFGQSMDDYAANVVYKKLNDTEIFDREVGNKQAYRVEAQNTEKVDKNLEAVEAQEWEDKKRFLSRDLPNYLWETKDTSVFSKILQWTPIISKSNERKSAVDKKGISDFMDAVSKISVGGGQKPELALLEAFKDAQTNWTDYQWQERFAENDIYVQTERDMRKIIDAGRFYVRSQRVDASVEDQHNLYLSILGVVEHEGGVNEAIAKFMDDVNAHKENKLAESKKQNDKDGETLQNKDVALYNIANKFNQRYTRALRLSEMDENSFSRSAVDILSDLNNDGTLTYADKGVTKTGFEFKRIVDMVGEKDAINHLINQAKIMNDTMGLGLTEEDLNAEEIQKGNKKLILVLQNIISQPGGDLYPLLVYGTDSAKKYKEAFDRLPESKDDPVVLAATDELLKDIKIEDLEKIEGVENPTDREGVRQAVAGRLFAEYTRGVGLGGSLSFDEWVKGVSLNGGLQMSESGASVGLTLAYNPQINLGKGRTITPGASFGFVPLFNTSAGGSVEVAKQWIDKNSIAQRIGVRGGFTEVFGISQIYSVSAGRSRDKLAGIEGDRRNIESQFNEQIMTPLLNSIAEKLGENKVLNLEDETVRSQVKEAIGAQVEKVVLSEDKSKLKQGDKEKLIDNTIRFLSFFDKADLSNEDVRKAIANKMAEQYSYAREDQHLNDIDGKTYLSGARLGFSWVQLGVYGVGVIHAGLSFTKHEHDIYGDRSFGRHTLRGAERFKSYSSWNEEMIAEFNKNLPEGKEISLNPEGYVVIPQNLFRDAYINPGMKGLIKKDESGNILLHPETRIDLPTITAGSATESIRISIGGFSRGMVRLNDVTDDWFTTDSIDASKLTGKENIFAKEILDRELQRLKDSYPEDQDLQNYEFDENMLSGLERGKKYRIILVKDGQGISTKVEETTEGRGLSIEYEPLDKKMLVGKEATIVANDTYAEALRVTSNALYNISHDRNNKLNSEYRAFANAVKDQQYENAKATILAMLPKMDNYINQYQQKNNKVDFSKVSETLKNLEGAELGKALMSINNVFARVSSVHGGTDGLYHFKIYDSVNQKLLDRDMGSIVEARAKEISGKIDRSDLDDDVKSAYKNLITFAEEYRKNNLDKYSDTKKQAKTLENAIGINLGNAINIENPLFNPEVYADSVIENPEFDGVDVLKGRALNVVAGNRALMNPVLTSLGFDDNAEIKIGEYDKEKGQLSLDINGKNVILKADMKIALFAQCVNHMLILDKIYAEIPGEKRKVEFGSSVMGDGNVNEGIVGNMFTSSKTSGDVAITAFRKSPEPEPDKPEPDGTTTPGEDEEDITPDGSSQPGEIEKPANDGSSNPGENPGGGENTNNPEVGGEGNHDTQGGGDMSTGGTDTNNPESGGETNGGGSNGGQEGGNNDTTPVAGEGQGGSQSGGIEW